MSVHDRGPEVDEALVRAIECEAPTAELRFEVTCLECEYGWSCDLDIVHYLWTEVEQLAQRTFLDVHALATGYGWNEEEILALSERRRSTYIAMLP